MFGDDCLFLEVLIFSSNSKFTYKKNWLPNLFMQASCRQQAVLPAILMKHQGQLRNGQGLWWESVVWEILLLAEWWDPFGGCSHFKELTGIIKARKGTPILYLQYWTVTACMFEYVWHVYDTYMTRIWHVWHVWHAYDTHMTRMTPWNFHNGIELYQFSSITPENGYVSYRVIPCHTVSYAT